MRRYRVKLSGANGLIMHSNDLGWREKMEKWGADPENKRSSRPGDDRTPAWRWAGCLYHDSEWVGVPSDNLMTAIREGGAKVPVPGKRSLTYKKQSQSGIVVDQVLWPLVVNGKRISWPSVKELVAEAQQSPIEYSEMEARAMALGIELFAKPCKVGQSSHVRVRPRFDRWTAEGSVTVHDDTITEAVLGLIWDAAGRYSGLGDWRPSAPKGPGPWGTFTTEIEVLR